MNALELSILRTIVYFDIFDYPLTLLELWKFLWAPQKFSYEEIAKVLQESPELKKRLGQKQGFVFIKDRSNLIETRLRRNNRAISYWRRAFLATRALRFIPFVRMVAVCNNLANHNTKSGSDIDLYIITKAGRIWTTRFLAVLLIQVLGLRRHGKKISRRICLSFFATEHKLNLENIALHSGDPYLLYFTAQVTPIFDDFGIYNKFWQTNSWIKKEIPNIYKVEPVDYPRLVKHNGFSKLWQRVSEFVMCTILGDLTEKGLRKIQTTKMVRNKESKQFEDSTAVIISDDMLKFHEGDRRKEYREKYQIKYSEILL
ncbi:MAG: hypothetical protein ABIE68_03010 [bacterium]